MPTEVSSCHQIISCGGWNFKCFSGTSYLEDTEQPSLGSASVWFVYAVLLVPGEWRMKYSCWWPFIFSSLRACAIILLKRIHEICLLLNMPAFLWGKKWRVYKISFPVWIRSFEWTLGKVMRASPVTLLYCFCPPSWARGWLSALELHCGWGCVLSIRLMFANSSAMQMFYSSLCNFLKYTRAPQDWHHFGCHWGIAV